ncbi:Slam-dependent surface lipoprotein [Xenorhabdus szentirmaii]|uniref:Slam-dependent surface lipoprotein n=1 Tax=Xenorhabdus szentirmaii TaxID=290112 RepID=UPI0019BA1F28|nr:Slam-dependent surface lipoprotein [Xenorhabdus sp. CUL]MBD2792853.1 transferrin-binding protein-like solute binding protein [Xenorhabdus sp. CUL]
MKKINIFIATLGVFGLIAQAQAKVSWGISQTETNPHLLIGENKGEPAIGISLPLFGNQLYTASELKDLATRDNNGIYRYKLEDVVLVENQYIDVGQVPNEEIYFGEWAQKTPDKSDITHTVFYVGKDVTTNMPKGGTAIYTIKGLNKYNGNNLLDGTFTANFDKNKINGSLSNDTLKININADINDDAGFAGEATANESIHGKTDGKFYGDSASALAGYAKFESDRSKDTAFGGSKQ